jgi:hypothetical protein
MRWKDRVYGEVAIEDPGLLALIETPTFQRLKGIKQAGPSTLAFSFKVVTRFEHSLGVHILLRRLGADRRQQVAGLLHDVSHTAFSHAVDFVVDSEEQDHHEDLKHLFLKRSDLSRAIEALGYEPTAFEDDAVFPLLERPLPWLCADRIDYFLRDAITCRVLDGTIATRILNHLTVVGNMIAFDDLDVARLAVERFSVMNRDWWASPTEAYLYNEFADVLREGFRIGALSQEDLFEDDAHVLQRLHAAGNALIESKLEHISNFRASLLEGFEPRVVPKTRRIDPAVVIDGAIRPFSAWC